MRNVVFRPGPRRTITFLLLALSLPLAGCLKRTLFTGIAESEAREVVIALYKGNVGASVIKEPRARGQEEDRWQVDVQGGERTRVEAWRILQENGLPRHKESGIEDVYKNSQIIPTATEERARFLLAISGELSRSLKTIPGVVDARVHIAIPDSSVLRDPSEKPRPTASVLIKYWSGYPEPQTSPIAKLLANGVEGLQEKDISVMIARLQPMRRDEVDDLRKSISPTVGLIVDYAYWGGSILGAIALGWIALAFAPGIIRWLRTQAATLKESFL